MLYRLAGFCLSAESSSEATIHGRAFHQGQASD